MTEDVCPICLDAFDESDHRMTALMCGHIFGSRCLSGWLQTHRQCPTCKRKVKRNQTILLYMERPAMRQRENDNSSSHVGSAELEKVKEKYEAEIQRLKERLLFIERCRASEVKKGVIDLCESPSPARKTRNINKTTNNQFTSHGSYSIEQSSKFLVFSRTNFPVCFVCTRREGSVVVVRVGRGSLLGRVEYTFPSLHTEGLSCMTIDATDRLLTCGRDMKVKISRVGSSRPLSEFPMNNIPSICEWDATFEYRFFCGTQDGYVYSFDSRMPGRSVSTVALAEKGTADSSFSCLSFVSLSKLGVIEMNASHLVATSNGIYSYNHDDEVSNKLVCKEGSGSTLEHISCLNLDAEYFRASRSGICVKNNRLHRITLSSYGYTSKELGSQYSQNALLFQVQGNRMDLASSHVYDILESDEEEDKDLCCIDHDDSVIRLWDLNANKRISEYCLTGTSSIAHVDMDSKQWLGVLSADGNIQVMNIRKKRRR